MNFMEVLVIRYIKACLGLIPPCIHTTTGKWLLLELIIKLNWLTTLPSYFVGTLCMT
jgi:hypothetical protein